MLRRIDEQGYFVEDVLIDNIPYLTETVTEEITNEDGATSEIQTEKIVMEDILGEDGSVIGQEPVISPYYISTSCPEGFYKPKWNGTEWTEGLTLEEISSINLSIPKLTQDEQLDQLATDVNDALYAIMTLSIE